MKTWISPGTSFHNAQSWQARGYRTGAALASHTAQHGGVVDPDCPACAEIVRKMDRTAKLEGLDRPALPQLN